MSSRAVKPGRWDASRRFVVKHFDKIAATVGSLVAVLQAAHQWAGGSLNVRVLGISAGVIVGVLMLVRLRLTRNLLARLLLPAPREQHVDELIFRGPLPYTSDDENRLPCRGKEITALWQLIQKHSFVVVDGESGCGKSSLVAAGVLPQAVERYRVEDLRVGDGDAQRLLDAVDQADSQQADAHKPVLLCLDQFEEVFVNVPDQRREKLFAAVRDIVSRGDTKVLVVLRSDFLDLFLAACRAADPGQAILDLGNYYTLGAFDRDQAQSALGEMLSPALSAAEMSQRDNLHDLIDQLTLDLLRPPRDERLSREDRPTVLPVELQIVGMMCERIGLNRMTAAQFHRLGGKAGLTRQYIEDVKQRILRSAGVGEPVVSNILCRLISSVGTKQAVSAARIDAGLRLPAGQARRVLEICARQYLVKQIAAAPEDDTFELLHDHLAELLDTAADARLQKARVAQKRLQFWLGQGQRAISSGERHAATEKKNPAVSIVARCAQPFSLFTKGLSNLFRQRVPVGEILTLWPYATGRDARRMLRRSLLGFAARAMLVLLPLVILVGAGAWKIQDQRAEVRLSRTTAQLHELGFKVVDDSASCGDRDLTQEKLNRALGLLAQFPLRQLRLDGCRKIEHIEGAAELTELRELNLAGCERLRSVAGVQKLTNLQTLDISECCSLESLEQVNGLPRLTTLNARQCDWLGRESGDTIAGLHLPALETLDLEGNDGIEVIEDFDAPALNSLSLRGCVNLRQLSRFHAPRLASADLAMCRSIGSLKSLSHSPELQELTLSGCRSVSSFAPIESLTALKKLDLRGCPEEVVDQYHQASKVFPQLDEVLVASPCEGLLAEILLANATRPLGKEAYAGQADVTSASPPDLPTEQPGAVVVFNVVGIRYANGKDVVKYVPGDEIDLTLSNGGDPHRLRVTIADMLDTGVASFDELVLVDRTDLGQDGPFGHHFPSGNAIIIVRLAENVDPLEVESHLREKAPWEAQLLIVWESTRRQGAEGESIRQRDWRRFLQVNGDLHWMCNPSVAEKMCDRLRADLGDDLAAITWVVSDQAIASFGIDGESSSKPVEVFGIDRKSFFDTCQALPYLQHPRKRASFDFTVEDGGYDTWAYCPERGAIERSALASAGAHRRLHRWRINAWMREEFDSDDPFAAPLNDVFPEPSEPLPLSVAPDAAPSDEQPEDSGTPSQSAELPPPPEMNDAEEIPRGAEIPLDNPLR